MMFTKVEISGLYSFKNTSLDLTYERKLANNTVEDEFLNGCEAFNIKRVCILSGANASGKTTFGKVLCGLQNYLSRGDIVDYLSKGLSNEEVANILVEYVVPIQSSWYLRSVSLLLCEDGILSEEYTSIKIGARDSSRVARRKLAARTLEGISGKNQDDYVKVDFEIPGSKSELSLDIIGQATNAWNYLFLETSSEAEKSVWRNPKAISAEFIYKILHTYDPNISRVAEVYEKPKAAEELGHPDGFNIHFSNGDKILVDSAGEVARKDRLSKGTYQGIRVTDFIARVIAESKEEHVCPVYYLDEQLVHSHSEIEKGIVNLILEKLGRNAQFFHTTHNYDLLDMNLPIHSFAFLRKDKFTEIIAPEKEFKKSDRSLVNYVKNDIFGTLPNLEGIDELFMENDRA